MAVEWPSVWEAAWRNTVLFDGVDAALTGLWQMICDVAMLRCCDVAMRQRFDLAASLRGLVVSALYTPNKGALDCSAASACHLPLR